ncbi:MAG: NAD(P)-binding protein [Veillonellaceae bacterium]|nr:NAD(P)-binding protein [Veillonellaceae bacterium]
MKVAILGGGISGIGVAHFLLAMSDDPSLEVHLFEKRPTMGGVCQTIELDGFRFDLGPHNIHSIDQWFNGYMEALLGEEYRARTYQPLVVFRGHFVPYPMKGLDILKSVSLLTSASCAGSFLWSRIESLFTEWKDDSFEDFIINRFGRKLYRIFFGPFTEKTWGVPGRFISADFGRQRIGVFTLWDLFKRTVLGIKPKTMDTEEDPFLNSRCVYPDFGSGTIIDSLLEPCLADARFHSHLSSSVEGLDRNGRGFIVRSGELELEADICFSSLALTDLCRMLGLPMPGLEYVSTRFVLLMLDRESVFGKTPWVYFSDDRTRFNRISEPRNMSPLMAPEGKTSLCVEFTTTGRDDISMASHDRLTEWAVKGLEQYGLVKPGNLISSHVIDWENTYPLRTLGYREEVSKALEEVSSIPGIITHGRLGRFEYMNMDHCVIEARALCLRLKQQRTESYF